jgi:hypothetical protein
MVMVLIYLQLNRGAIRSEGDCVKVLTLLRVSWSSAVWISELNPEQDHRGSLGRRSADDQLLYVYRGC